MPPPSFYPLKRIHYVYTPNPPYLDGLRAFIELVKQGGTWALDEIVNFLRIFLRNALTVLRSVMTRKAFEQLLKQLLQKFLTPLADLIGESLWASILWILLAVIAGAAIGIGIGYPVGNIKLADGRTVWEAWGTSSTIGYGPLPTIAKSCGGLTWTQRLHGNAMNARARPWISR